MAPAPVETYHYAVLPLAVDFMPQLEGPASPVLGHFCVAFPIVWQLPLQVLEARMLHELLGCETFHGDESLAEVRAYSGVDLGLL